MPLFVKVWLYGLMTEGLLCFVYIPIIALIAKAGHINRENAQYWLPREEFLPFWAIVLGIAALWSFICFTVGFWF
jgi:hypothetical protein